jgi:hypothetical protein
MSACVRYLAKLRPISSAPWTPRETATTTPTIVHSCAHRSTMRATADLPAAAERASTCPRLLNAVCPPARAMSSRRWPLRALARCSETEAARWVQLLFETALPKSRRALTWPRKNISAESERTAHRSSAAVRSHCTHDGWPTRPPTVVRRTRSEPKPNAKECGRLRTKRHTGTANRKKCGRAPCRHRRCMRRGGRPRRVPRSQSRGNGLFAACGAAL